MSEKNKDKEVDKEAGAVKSSAGNYAKWFFSPKPANPFAPMAAISRSLFRNSIQFAAALFATPPDRRFDGIAAIGDRQQQFLEVLRINGRSIDDLPALEVTAKLRFFIYLTATIVFIAIAALSPTFGLLAETGYPVFDRFFPWALTVPMFFLTVKASFILYQIRMRSLEPIHSWLRCPHAWLGGGVAHQTTTSG